MERLSFDEANEAQRIAAIARAARALRDGALVAFPTETVYGLGACAGNREAVARLFDVKGRPIGKPISLLVDSVERARQLAAVWPVQAERLAQRFWPGPLTIVVEAKEEVSEIVRAGGPTVGLRVPAHQLTRMMLQQVGQPIAAPSANPSGAPAPIDADGVMDLFGDTEAIALVLDGGRCTVQIASTIVDVTGRQAKVLREGAIATQSILECVAGMSGA